ncbi:ubiquitin protein ligase 5 [Actinidia rufa]|uniref:HECT-type E3 ubiquitin transferase n=1 Tax=Actinidia rufa TaxID=165716 RepID=A0A7J0F459_9ERIC|nr:ubiquitin protein ligase 5 [Actinidia rufa]
MHKVQVGIVFDRVFFLQLAGALVSLEDIRDADPFLYKSCKEILEMDAEMIDSDALGLTFVHEVEELGSRKTVELCTGGKSISVNSQNRGKYVDLLIEHRFVTSISEQVAHFAQGFADILCNSRLQNFFFKSLELEDLDWMLKLLFQSRTGRHILNIMIPTTRAISPKLGRHKSSIAATNSQESSAPCLSPHVNQGQGKSPRTILSTCEKEVVSSKKSNRKALSKIQNVDSAAAKAEGKPVKLKEKKTETRELV